MRLKRQKRNIPLWIALSIALFLSFATYNQNADLIEADFDQKLQTLDLGYSSPPTVSQIFKDLPEIIENKIKGYPRRPPLERIDIDIPLIEYKKILHDREVGLKHRMLTSPQDVKAKIRYKGKVLKAKLRLKGDQVDHWNSQYRMSFRVSLKKGRSILGFRKFSLHKPDSRQHPFDQAYSEVMKAAGNLASNHSYIHVYVNGMDWGVMNIEEHMSKEFLEKQRKKESFVLRFGSDEKGRLNKVVPKGSQYLMYRLGDARLNLKVYDSNSYLEEPLQRKRISYVAQERIKQQHSQLYDAESYGRAFINSLIWNDGHALANFNSRHYFNPYTLKLEPITADSVWPLSINTNGLYRRQHFDPLTASYLYRQVISSKEYRDVAEKSLRKVINANEDTQEMIDKFQRYFPLDKKIDASEIIKNNLKIVYNFKDQYLLPDLSSRGYSLKNKSPIQAFHRDDGNVEIFSDVPDKVELKSIIFDGARSQLLDQGIKLPRFSPYMRKPIRIKTSLKGNMTGRIEIKVVYQGLEYISKVEPTVGKLAYIVPKPPRFDFTHKHPTDDQAGYFPKHLHVRHFMDGRIQIYNLLDEDVVLEEIRLDGERVSQGAVVIPGFIAGLYEPITIKTSLKGIFDDRISVKTSYKGYERTHSLSYTLDDSDIHNPLLANDRNTLPRFIEKFTEGRWGIRKGVWDIKSPMLVRGDLMIQAGTTLRFSKDSYLIIKGGIYAEGNEREPIVFTASHESWKGLYILNASRVSKFSYVKIEKTKALEDGLLALTGGVTFYRSNIIMNNVQFNGSNAEDALNIVESKFDLNHVTVNSARSDGIDFDFSEGDIRQSEFFDIGGDALDFSGSNVTASNLNIYDVHDKALSVGEATKIDLKAIVINDVGVGIASKDGSSVTGSDISITAFHLNGIMSYMKKSFYGKPSINLDDVSLPLFESSLSRQKGTDMQINGVEISSKSLNVKALYKSETMAK